LSDPIRDIINSYDSFIVRAYSRLRFAILRQPFLEEIGQYLPTAGRILDLGCGFGLFSLYFAATYPDRSLCGVDLNRRRIDYAWTSAERLRLSNVEYHIGDAFDWNTSESFDAIYLLDLLHHMPREKVNAFLEKATSLLRDDGILIVKEVANRPRYKMWFTLLLDRLMVGWDPIYYWPPHDLSAMLEQLGFDVVRHRMIDILPYPHILYIGRRIRP